MSADDAADTQPDGDQLDTAGNGQVGAAGDGQIGAAQAAIDEARRRVADVPAEVVITNHVMGLYELAAIHLSLEQPNLPSAALAIDAVASLVEGLGDRLGPEAATMRDALGNIRLAFVEVKSRVTAGENDRAAQP